MKRKLLRGVLYFVLVIIVLGIGLLMTLSFLGKRPNDLGVTDGRLKPCPDTPNCVNSQSDTPQHAIPPIPFQGPAAEAGEKIRSALLQQPRTQIVSDDGDYIHAESRSALFRFVDDVEIYIDAEQQVIHIRSASRVGRSDLGVNRQRVESIRKAFANAPPVEESN